MLIHWHAKDPRIWQKYIRKEYTIQGSVLAAQTLNKNLKKNVNEKSNFAELTGMLPGASTGDPTHDKVMWKRPDEQGRSELKGPPGPAWASTPQTGSVCLTILCLSPTLLTLTGVYPRPPFSGKNQLRALVYWTWKEYFNSNPSDGFLAYLTGLSRFFQLLLWLFTAS